VNIPVSAPFFGPFRTIFWLPLSILCSLGAPTFPQKSNSTLCVQKELGWIFLDFIARSATFNCQTWKRAGKKGAKKGYCECLFHLDATEPTVKPEEKYVHICGLTPTCQWGTCLRIIIKPSYVRYCSDHDDWGRLPPKEPIHWQLYLVRINCHLSHGCEISPESEDMGVQQLCKVQPQGSFICQMLNLPRGSTIGTSRVLVWSIGVYSQRLVSESVTSSVSATYVTSLASKIIIIVREWTKEWMLRPVHRQLELRANAQDWTESSIEAMPSSVWVAMWSVEEHCSCQGKIDLLQH
jgi:hypothetical protein